MKTTGSEVMQSETPCPQSSNPKRRFATKSFKLIFSIIILGFFVFLVESVPLERGKSERVRLKEPRIKPLAASDLTAEQQRILSGRKRPGDRIENIYTTLLNHPRLAEKWIDGFPAYIYNESTLPSREREMLILRIGWLCRCEYVFGHHTEIGISEGLTDEEIRRITEGPKATGWDPFDKTLLEAVDELYYDNFITDARWNFLAKRYNKQQLMDAVATVGQYNMVSTLMNCLGVQLEKGVPGFPGRKER